MENTDLYESFVNKFKPKKTTDDCYTPPNVYDAVLSWVRQRYDIRPNTRIIRPFFPNGDYQKEDYSGDCVVVDNPPFSILGSITDYYQSRGIRFFMFAPSLTLFTYLSRVGITALPTGSSITYENGAVVMTSFICNLSPELKIDGSADLYRRIEQANMRGRGREKDSLPKYEYPYEVARAAQVAAFVAKGIDVQILDSECLFVRGLDSQKDKGKTIFGGGLLLNSEQTQKQQMREQQMREQQPREVWCLSERERQLIKELDAPKRCGLFE